MNSPLVASGAALAHLQNEVNAIFIKYDEMFTVLQDRCSCLEAALEDDSYGVATLPGRNPTPGEVEDMTTEPDDDGTTIGATPDVQESQTISSEDLGAMVNAAGKSAFEDSGDDLMDFITVEGEIV